MSRGDRQQFGGRTQYPAEAVLRAGREKPGSQIDRIEIYGADGEVMYQAKLGNGC